MFVYNINVPLNDEGVKELEDMYSEMPNVKLFDLSFEEYSFLRKSNGLFCKFNKAFGCLIDACEEEIIEYSNLEKALEIVKVERKKTSNREEMSALDKIENSLRLALESNTLWEIEIFLG